MLKKRRGIQKIVNTESTPIVCGILYMGHMVVYTKDNGFVWNNKTGEWELLDAPLTEAK